MAFGTLVVSGAVAGGYFFGNPDDGVNKYIGNKAWLGAAAGAGAWLLTTAVVTVVKCVAGSSATKEVRMPESV